MRLLRNILIFCTTVTQDHSKHFKYLKWRTPHLWIRCKDTVLWIPEVSQQRLAEHPLTRNPYIFEIPETFGDPFDQMDYSGSCNWWQEVYNHPNAGKDYTWYISCIYYQLGDFISPTTHYGETEATIDETNILLVVEEYITSHPLRSNQNNPLKWRGFCACWLSKSSAKLAFVKLSWKGGRKVGWLWDGQICLFTRYVWLTSIHGKKRFRWGCFTHTGVISPYFNNWFSWICMALRCKTFQTYFPKCWFNGDESP